MCQKQNSFHQIFDEAGGQKPFSDCIRPTAGSGGSCWTLCRDCPLLLTGKTQQKPGFELIGSKPWKYATDIWLEHYRKSLLGLKNIQHTNPRIKVKWKPWAMRNGLRFLRSPARSWCLAMRVMLCLQHINSKVGPYSWLKTHVKLDVLGYFKCSCLICNQLWFCTFPA